MIVVDNGSSDNSVSLARAAGAKVVSLSQNYGFSYAVNAGVQASLCHWVVILNNDVELEPGWVETLLASAERQSAWFAVGKLFNAKRRELVDGTFDAICRGGTAWRCGSGQQDSPSYKTSQPILLAPFTAVLVRKNLFSRVGPLDERFESYLEDVDFGLRCAQQGLGGVYVPERWDFMRAARRWARGTLKRCGVFPGIRCT